MLNLKISKMKHLQKLMCTLVCMLLLSSNLMALEYLQVGSKTRSMIVYAPANIPQNRPLLINMHGLNQDAAYQQAQAQWKPIADAEKFVVVYPNAINKSWDINGTTDIDFILAIIERMSSRYGIDRNRVYLSGFSMGGMMTYYAATKIADKIAAFGPVSGYLMGGPNTNSSRPIPIIHVHGTSDNVVPYSGVQSCLNAWITRNGCSTPGQVTDPYPSWKTGSTAYKTYWGGGDQNSEIVLITLEGKGHWWSMDSSNSVSTSQEIWNFCKNFSLNSGGGSSGGDELINNSVYEIEFATNSNKVLDLRYGEDANGAVLQPWDKLNNTAQRWVAVSTGDGYWRFISKASGSNRCIDLDSGNATNGTSIRLWDNYANDAQAWKVTDVGNGYYKVTSKLDASKSWDVPNCVMDGSKTLQLWDYYGTSCQLFKFNYVGLKSATITRDENVGELKFSIYPNPSTNGQFEVSISGGNEDVYELHIYSVDGKKVYSKADLLNGINKVNTGLKPGMYVVKFSGQSIIEKLIVK